MEIGWQSQSLASAKTAPLGEVVQQRQLVGPKAKSPGDLGEGIAALRNVGPRDGDLQVLTGLKREGRLQVIGVDDDLARCPKIAGYRVDVIVFLNRVVAEHAGRGDDPATGDDMARLLSDHGAARRRRRNILRLWGGLRRGWGRSRRH
jgi:hypothetical protein